MSVFDDFINSLKNNLSDLFKAEAADVKNTIIKDGSDFAIEQKENIEKYTQQYLSNQISQEDLKDLVDGIKELFELKGLKDLGLAQAKIQEIKDKVIQAITDSICSLKL